MRPRPRTADARTATRPPRALSFPCAFGVLGAGLVATLMLVAPLSAQSPAPTAKGLIAPVEAEEPAALVALPGGGLRYGERRTGRIFEVAPLGTAPRLVDHLDVVAAGQRGLLGLAIDRQGRTFASWTRPDGRLVLGQVGEGTPRLVWLGPRTKRRANGGHLVAAPDGSLIVGVGDLLNAAQVDDPEAPNGKLLAVDPDGPTSQRPTVVSAGWNNPFAFTVTDSGELWVADNTGRDGVERIARGDRHGRPSAVTSLRRTRAPSGIAALAERKFALCGFVSGRLERVDASTLPARIERKPIAGDCSLGVVGLADGTLAYADETAIRFVRP